MLTALLLGWLPLPTHTVQRAAAAQPALRLQRVWTQRITPNADSAPAYLAHARTGRPLVYVLAANNTANCSPGNPVRSATLYALDAGSGQVRWTRSTSGPSRCSTAGPVVDPSGRWVYAPGLDGKLHRYAALSGKESRGTGWPVTVTRMPDVEKISDTPTITKQFLYITTSGFIGDQGHYEGHIVTVDLGTGRVHVFNSLCSGTHALLGPSSGAGAYCPFERSGMFGRGQGVVDPVSRDVYVVSGNGPWNGKTEWGDSILKLNPAGTKLLDSYTPLNQKALEDSDQDLGSTGPALLAPVKQNGVIYHLLVQGGKGPACDSCHGAALRLLNRDDLSGHGGPGHLGGDLFDTTAPGGCEVLTAPAAWKSATGTPWVIYADGCGIAAYRVGGTAPHFRLDRVWAASTGGGTPIVHGGVLYVVSPGAVTALDPATGRRLAGATGLGSIHWEYPLVQGHRVYLSDEGGRVYCFALST